MHKSELTGYPSIDKPWNKGYSFIDKQPIVPNTSIYNALKLMSLSFKKENAVDCLNLKSTFEELFRYTNILARSFKELGIKQGDILTISMPNFFQALASFLACNKIGATATFLNCYAPIKEIQSYLNLFESPLFINYNKDKEYNEEIKRKTKVRYIITLNEEDLNKKAFNNQSSQKIGYSDFISFADMQLISNFYKKYLNSLYGKKQNSLILFTSGSTGKPKSVVLTNENILATGMYLKASSRISNTIGEKSLVCVPFCYPYGFVTSTLMSLLCGRSVILAPDLSKDNISYYLTKNPNIIFGSPALLELIMKNIPQNQDLSSVNLFISGGDFLYPNKSLEGEYFFSQHNANVIMSNGSGNAETTGCGTNSVGIENRLETVGKPLVGSDAIVVNEQLEECKYNEEGILLVHGKHVFKEYFNEPELTEKAFIMINGKKYFNTGTRGYIDEKGYFILTGRESRFYIMSTLNKIYCERIQSFLSHIDVIDSCAVVEKPDDDLLYVNKAFIVLKKGIVETEEVLNYIKMKCASPIHIMDTGETVQLKPYEIPSSFTFLPMLPRNKADKIDYEYLKELAKKEYEEEKGKSRQRK